MSISDLGKVFSPLDIEWRVQSAGFKNGKPWAMVLAYVTNRAIMNRLDEVCTPFGWKNEFRVDSDGAVMCGISCKHKDEWVTKWDGAEATAVEAIKGGRSSAMKRAGVQWGIGRYLYNLDTCFAETQMERPPNHEKPLWGDHYDKSEKKRFYWKHPTLPSWALPKAEGEG